MPESEEPMSEDVPEKSSGRMTSVRTAQFAEAEPDEEGDKLSLDLLMDVGLPARVEIGRVRLTVEELLGLRKGSVVKLDRTAGEPVNLYVRDKCFAHGEVVVADNNFAFRVTEIVSDGRRVPHPQRDDGGGGEAEGADDAEGDDRPGEEQ